MVTEEQRAKVASITVIVDDSPVIMIFTNVQAALKLKRRLREVFPDTVFTKAIEDRMIKTYAKKTAGLIIQRHLLIPSTLASGDTRIEIPMRPYNESSQPVAVCPIEMGTPCPASYKAALNERLKDAEKPSEAMQAAATDLYSKVTANMPNLTPVVYKPPENPSVTHPVVLQRPELYNSQVLAASGSTTNAGAAPTNASVAPSVSTAATIATTSGGTPMHAASLVPVSLHNGNQLSAIAGVLGQGAMNTGLSVYNIAGAPAIQSIGGSIAGFASLSGQPMRAVSALTPVSVGAIAGQPGYGSAFAGHLSVPPTIVNSNYQGMHQASSYPAFSPSQFIAAASSGSLNIHQLSPVVSSSAIQSQLAANQGISKISTQPMSMVPVPIQSAAIGPTMIPVSFSSISAFGQARIPAGLSELHSPASTVGDVTPNDHAKLKDSPVYSASRPKTSPEVEPTLALRGDTGPVTSDPVLPGMYPPRAPETFFANTANVLYAKGPTLGARDTGSCRLLSEAVNAWRSTVDKEQSNASIQHNLDSLVKDGPFHQYYKQISQQHAVDPMIDAEMPRLWPTQNQIALFLALSDQLFNQLPDNAKSAWFTQREALFNSLTVEGATGAKQQPPPKAPQDPTYPVTAGGLIAVGAPLSLQPIDQPTLPDAETLRAGQELLKSDVADTQNMWLRALFNMPSTCQFDTQIPDSLAATDNLRQRLEPGTQEAIAQMITQLNFTCNKSGGQNPPPKGGLALPTKNLSIEQSIVNYLIPPDDSLKMDVFILLYMLSLGGNLQKLAIDSREFELLYKEFPPGCDKNHIYDRYVTLCTRLIALYQSEGFMEIQASKLGPSQNESIQGCIKDYVSSAQKENTLLRLALQKNDDPGKAISSLTSILLDEEHILFVLYGPGVKSLATMDKGIDFLLESIAFMNRQLTRKEFYRRGRLSKPVFTASYNHIGADLNSLLKKQIRL